MDTATPTQAKASLVQQEALHAAPWLLHRTDDPGSLPRRPRSSADDGPALYLSTRRNLDRASASAAVLAEQEAEEQARILAQAEAEADAKAKAKAKAEKKAKAQAKAIKAEKARKKREARERREAEAAAAAEAEQLRAEEEEGAEPVSVYYENCTAARNAGAAPVYAGEPGYGRHLDRDGDGVGCE